MDELINFLARPEPDCFLRYRMHCNAEFYYVWKIPWAWLLGARETSQQGRVVLDRNTVVARKCALPSALLVSLGFRQTLTNFYIWHIVYTE